MTLAWARRSLARHHFHGLGDLLMFFTLEMRRLISRVLAIYLPPRPQTAL